MKQEKTSPSQTIEDPNNATREHRDTIFITKDLEDQIFWMLVQLLR